MPPPVRSLSANPPHDPFCRCSLAAQTGLRYLIACADIRRSLIVWDTPEKLWLRRLPWSTLLLATWRERIRPRERFPDGTYQHRTPAMAIGLQTRPLSIGELMRTQVVGRVTRQRPTLADGCGPKKGSCSTRQREWGFRPGFELPPGSRLAQRPIDQRIEMTGLEVASQ
jgi:hypothetical protein